MKRTIAGGFTCSVSGCNENTGRSQHLSFFRFPSQPERAKLWVEACSMKKNVSPKKLYNNYRVCSKHFAPHMFLNDLRNRLQPHAIPLLNIQRESSTVQNDINVQTSPEHCMQTTKSDAWSIVAISSITNLTDADINDNKILKSDKGTQTELGASDCCSSKIAALKRKCDAAIKRAKRAKIRIEKEKILEDITSNDFHTLMYKFYPKPMVEFLKVQASNLNNKKKW